MIYKPLKSGGVWCRMHAKQPILLVLLSTLMLSGCSDSFLPPLLGDWGGSSKTKMEKETERAAAVINGDITAPAPAIEGKKNLFGRSLRSDDERLDRLERAVQSLRNDFDTVEPSIRRLMAIESDIQDLTDELRRLAQDPAVVDAMNNPAPAPMMAKPAPIMQKNKAASKRSYQTKSAPPVQDGVASIFDVRTGEHPGKTRIVLDINANTNYSVDIDNNESIMIVDLPNTSWNAPRNKSFPKSSVISSYNVEQSGNGHLMVIQLKKNARLSYNKSLPSTKGIGRRIVLDVSPQ